MTTPIPHEPAHLRRDQYPKLLLRNSAWSADAGQEGVDPRVVVRAILTDELITSLGVIDELNHTPEPKRSECLDLIVSLPLLDITEEVDDLVETYIFNKVMPADAAGDALHLALATVHQCDILVSWNCRHIANANKTPHIRRINGRLGYDTPVLITPLELLNQKP